MYGFYPRIQNFYTTIGRTDARFGNSAPDIRMEHFIAQARRAIRVAHEMYKHWDTLSRAQEYHLLPVESEIKGIRNRRMIVGKITRQKDQDQGH